MKTRIALLLTGTTLMLLTACESGRFRSKGNDQIGYVTIDPKEAADMDMTAPQYLNPSVEEYAKIHENDFLEASSSPVSTFSVDVDRASYSNVKRFIEGGSLPPSDAVRIEELVNYFTYDYPTPNGKDPFAITAEVASCPWNTEHQLAVIGLQAKKIATENLPPSNLVFLIDVSGSMSEQNKLPLVKASLALLTEQLRPQDKVAIVVYAGAAGLVLPSTNGSDKKTITNALDKLEAGGSTAGSEGIKLAYEVAAKNFAQNGNNRVILCTDGDFNVGITGDNDLETFIEKKRETGIYLTCLGYGMGNYKDTKMEILADKGNGNYSYINDLYEAKKSLVNEFGGTLFTVAKDVKIQVEFNPAKVKSYRLVGYENRMLKTEDFTNDKKDAGEMGAGHTVTAIYEIVPVGTASASSGELKYQTSTLTAAAKGNELFNLKSRYKQPTDSVSIELVQPVKESSDSYETSSDNFRFASSVAMFGLLLRNSQYKGKATYPQLLALANGAKGADAEGYRAEFIRLVGLAQSLPVVVTNAK